jgi:sigma-B regulation protein RsbU (phosphoserine phosphatase)
VSQSTTSDNINWIYIQQRAYEILLTDAGSLILGSIILIAGLSAISVYCIRRKPKAGLIFWFGMIALLYGVRLLASTPTIRLLVGLQEEFWRYLVSSINYAILIPFVLFLIEIYGRGWRSSLRVLLWIQISYAVVGILADLVLKTPESLPDPVYLFFLGLTATLLLGRFHDYQPPMLEESRAIKIGLSLFILSVINEHLVGFSLVPWTIRLEALCFLLFVILLGYIAARRFLINEQKLIAMQHEMEAARQIQTSILPRELPTLEDCKMAVKYVPMTSVAGDFYDFITVDKTQLGILIADVTGHGVPAALVASMLKVGVLSQASSLSDPAAVLTGLNQILCKQLTGKFVTAGYLLIDPDEKTALYSGAAHPPLLLWRATEKTVIEHEENGLLLGFRPDEKYTNIRFKLASGDRIFLYTDGIIEVMDASGDLFGQKRFRTYIESHSHIPLDHFADSLLYELGRWSGNKSDKGYEDDLTLIVLEIGELAEA